jgi:diguanylate cyclase (GGDEF)-like protein
MRILIVEDEENARNALRDILIRRQFAVESVANGEEALRLLEQEEFTVLLTDLRMGDMDGIELSRRAKAIRPMLFIIILTAYGNVENAVQALKQGVYDYLIKPINTDVLLGKLGQIAELFSLRGEVEKYRKQLNGPVHLQDLIGQDPKMLEVFRLIRRAAATDNTVLITGETGTGKELAARAIHALSGRKGKAFIGVHCAAYSEHLIESELFGHAKGAFTGASQERKGKIRSAEGGTLFLDEISSISLNVQTKLLRLIQERRVEPVGLDQSIPVDLRLIAACNEELEPLIQSGEFRPDLYYRINVLHVHLPPLRSRRGDIPLLVYNFLKKKAAGRSVTLSPEVMEVLVRQPWPGNVRELENCVDAILAECPEGMILRKHLPFAAEALGKSIPGNVSKLDDLVEAFEKFLIIGALRKSKGRIGLTGKSLGLTERTLERRMQKYRLKKEEFKGEAEISDKGIAEIEVPPNVFEIAVQNSPDGVLIVDECLRVLAMNRALESMAGWESSEIVGKKRCVDFIQCTLDTEDKFSCTPERGYCQDLIQVGRSIPAMEMEIGTRNEGLRSISASMTPIGLTPGGGFNAAALVLRENAREKQGRRSIEGPPLVDEITGIPNREKFELELQGIINRARRYGGSFSVILLEIDEFSDLTDTFGAAAGTWVVRETARLIRSVIRNSDVIAHLETDAFGMILPEAGRLGCRATAEKIRETIATHVFQQDRIGLLRPVRLTVTIGSCLYPEDARSDEDLIRKADHALFEAKKTGMNQYLDFSDIPDAPPSAID